MSKNGSLIASEILVVDDEEDIRDLISAGILKDEGLSKPASRATAKSALAAVRLRRPQLLVLDIWLQGSKLDGIQVLDTLKREQPDLPVVMISGHGTIETAVASIKKGAYDFIEKPFKADRLIHVVGRALEAVAGMRREVAELQASRPATIRSEFDRHSRRPIVADCARLIDKIAPTGSRVLITGPSGSGKEVVARLIHGHSRRAGNAFVAINCANMSPGHIARDRAVRRRSQADERAAPRPASRSSWRTTARSISRAEVAGHAARKRKAKIPARAGRPDLPPRRRHDARARSMRG